MTAARSVKAESETSGNSTMRLEPTSARRMGEQRRYFPDWTALLPEICPELEADHNSYLAGGYAEEFGYRAQPGWSRGVLVLDDEPPELCQEWCCQAGSTHPGYPLKSHPLAVELDSIERAVSGDTADERLAQEVDAERHGTVIIVSNRVRERSWHHAARGAAIATRLIAALVSLRWTLRRG